MKLDERGIEQIVDMVINRLKSSRRNRPEPRSPDPCRRPTRKAARGDESHLAEVGDPGALEPAEVHGVVDVLEGVHLAPGDLLFDHHGIVVQDAGDRG